MAKALNDFLQAELIQGCRVLGATLTGRTGQRANGSRGATKNAFIFGTGLRATGLVGGILLVKPGVNPAVGLKQTHPTIPGAGSPLLPYSGRGTRAPPPPPPTTSPPPGRPLLSCRRSTGGNRQMLIRTDCRGRHARLRRLARPAWPVAVLPGRHGDHLHDPPARADNLRWGLVSGVSGRQSPALRTPPLRFRLPTRAGQPVTTGRRRVLRLTCHRPGTSDITGAFEPRAPEIPERPADSPVCPRRGRYPQPLAGKVQELPSACVRGTADGP